MQTITTIGLDIAKSVFQVHGVDVEGQVLIRRKLKRRYVLTFFEKLQPCLVGIEACATSHHWSRQLKALGHTVRLMPPAYVKPYVKRQKNDATDAEAICEAVTRANMRFANPEPSTHGTKRTSMLTLGMSAFSAIVLQNSICCKTPLMGSAKRDSVELKRSMSGMSGQGTDAELCPLVIDAVDKGVVMPVEQ